MKSFKLLQCGTDRFFSVTSPNESSDCIKIYSGKNRGEIHPGDLKHYDMIICMKKCFQNDWTQNDP